MKDNKAKIYMIFSLVVLVIVVIVSGTYAYYVWTTSDSDTTKIVAGIGAATVTFDGGSDISANLRPVSDKSKGIIKNISVKADTEGLVFNMYLDITSIDTGLKDESFRYELYKGDTKVKEGNFSDSYLTSNTVTCSKNNTNHIVLLTNESISTSKTSYTLYIWIDGANYTNPNTMMNKIFSFKLHADGEGAVLAKTAAQTITELYMNAEKETIQNNSIDYHIAPSVRLMSDRLGGTTEDLDSGNIRYYGVISYTTVPRWQTKTEVGGPYSSESECRTAVRNWANSKGWTDENMITNGMIPKYCTRLGTSENVYPNNYIYFNCNDYESQTSSTCELWRIIGVFDGKLKLMRNESIGKYSWDNKDTSTGAETDDGENDWTTARLMKLLNPSDYYTVDSNDNNLGQSLYYNSASGKCYSGQNNATVDCDFTSTGIKNDTTRNMIAETTWNLGEVYTSSLYPNQVYEYERKATLSSAQPTIWKGKIALAYPSDYGYATDLSQCSGKSNDYSVDTCVFNNWMTAVFNSEYGWLLNPNSYDNYIEANGIHSDGGFNSLSVYVDAAAAPVLYLNSDISIESGDGSESNPYKLSV